MIRPQVEQVNVDPSIALAFGLQDLARTLLVDAVGQVDAHRRHVAFEHITDSGYKQSILLLARFEIGEVRDGGEEHAFDVGKDDRAGLVGEHALHRIEKHLNDDLQVANVSCFGRDEFEDGFLSLALRVGKSGKQLGPNEA